MGVTAIKRVENRGAATVALFIVGNQGVLNNGAPIAPGQSLPVDIWIPWATNAGEFSGKRLELRVGGHARFWIWQAAKADGDYVRFSTDGAWHDPGERVHGVAAVDGDRTLVVQDGCIELTDFPVDLIADLRAALGPRGYRLCDQQPVHPHRATIPSVPKRSAVAFSMAGTPSDAHERRERDARFRYTDSGKRYEFEIEPATGVVTAIHPDGGRTPLTAAVSYDRTRAGERSAAPPFDLVAANGGRVLAKARGLDRFYVATMDHMFLQAGADGREFPVPSTYFKLDPESNRPGARVQDLTKHLAGCFADHPAAERFPLFRLLVEHDLADLMVVAVEPRVWHLLDARPPLGALNTLLLTYELIGRILARAEQLPSAPVLADLKAAAARLRQDYERKKQELHRDAPGASAPPAGVPTYPHVAFCRDGSPPITLPSIDFAKVLDAGVGHVHWHEQYERVTGGELQPLRTGRVVPEPLPPIGWADLYRFANGPVRDGDGYVDGTCNFYLLVQLKNGAYALLYLDEQMYFTQRWRLCSPDDHLGGGLALVTALAEDPARNPRVYPDWNRATFWDPFTAGCVGPRSRLAVSRQVLLVTGEGPGSNAARIYSINFSHGTMDRSWRWRALPAKAVTYDAEAIGGAEPTIPRDQGDCVLPQTIRLREDMTLHLKGARRMADGSVETGHWYQRYLPANNQLVPPAGALAPNAPPPAGYEHHWKFLPDKVFARADRFSHFGVHDAVDSRTQYYPLAPPNPAAEQSLAAGRAGTWLDTDRQLAVRAWKFWWPAPLRVPNVDIDVFEQYLGPPLKAPPSLFNPETRLRIVKRGARWIALHRDKRDDDLMPFADLPKTVRLRNGSLSVEVTLQPNLFVEEPPAVRRAHFWWEASGEAAMAFTAPHMAGGPMFDNVWRVRMAALDPAAGDPTRVGRVVWLLDVEREGRFTLGSDGYFRSRWTPTAAERADLTNYCSPAGEARFATSIWFEDVVGHVAAPEEVRWLPTPTMRVSVNPSTVPLGVPARVTIEAVDDHTAARLAGTVTIDDQVVGTTGTPFTHTFATRVEEEFDPEIRVKIRTVVYPVVTVSVPDYPEADVALQYFRPMLRLRIEPTAIPVGRAVQVTVRADDATTNVPVAGRVSIGGQDAGGTNAPFAYTFASAPTSGLVTAPGYPNRSVPFPLYTPQLNVWVEAPYLWIGRPTSLTVRAQDATTGAPVGGRVIVGGQDVAATNAAFAYTFGAAHPSGLVRASGYPDAAVPWPPLRTPRLAVSLQPYPVALGTAATYAVRAEDADTRALVDGSVTIDGTVVGRTNAPFGYTFRIRFRRIRDPETGGWTMEPIPPVGSVSAAGYATVPLDFGA